MTTEIVPATARPLVQSIPLPALVERAGGQPASPGTKPGPRRATQSLANGIFTGILLL